MQLTCRQCGSKILPEDIDIQKVLARCRQCGAEFDFREMMSDISAPPVATVKYTVVQPEEFTVSHQGEDLIINYRWYHKSAIGKFISFLIASGIVYLLFLFLSSVGLFQGDGIGIAIILFPLLIIFPVLCLRGVYRAICKFVNSTTIHINNIQLTVQHHPLPWNRNIEIAIELIDQLYCEEGFDDGKNVYNVKMLLKNGKTVYISQVYKMNQAGFIEQQIEAYLGIVDRPIKGEMLWV